MIPKLGWNW